MNAPCMGGWCHLRDKCRNHEPNGRKPVERMCETGSTDAFEPVRVVHPVGTWERPIVASMLRPADVFDGLLA
jgi:hypothetical protein